LATRVPVEIRRTVEVRGVGAFLLRRADRLQELLAVVGEDVDRLHVVVDDPDALLRIVGADVDRVRPAHQLVPLLPRLDDVALAVEDDEAVLPVRIDAELAIRRALDPDVIVFAFPRRQPLPRVLVGAADSGKRRRRRVSPEARDGEADARSELRQQDRLGRLHLRQLAAEEAVHAVRALGEDAFPGAVGPLAVAGQGADILRPAFDDFVRPRDILAPDRAGNGGEACGRRCLSLRRVPAIEEEDGKGGAEGERHKRHDDFTHV
jgi:hypothetical protein